MGYIIVVVVAAMTVAACSVVNNAIKSGDPQFAYNQAVQLYEEEKWDKASTLFEACRHNLHFIMNALENQMRNYAGKGSLFRRNKLHILRSDNNVNRLVGAKTGINAGKTSAQNRN